ncbi:neuroblastoma breakpoint family member 4-like [Choloepus didactylus]|uniref:neuroblastoma breakpoint family member 4-like n=1 Tax=Choloepus didactylus TaxID=27675 RepID=UPI00189ECD93|nr:neuroblastoma breakpoint family member 4-like [Choloepus didactylus]
MADSCSTSCDPRTEMNIQEINQELRAQLAKCKQDFRDLWEKFLMSQATSYSLANQLQKYKAKEHKDILESVLGEKLQFEEEELAEKPGAAAGLGSFEFLIQSQAQELSKLRQKVEEGRQVSFLLKQHFEDLITHNDPDKYETQSFLGQLAEGHQMAKHLACKLHTENYEDEDDKEELLDPSRLSSELEDTMEEVLQDSVDERYLSPSNDYNLSDSQQPSCSTSSHFQQHGVCCVSDVATPSWDACHPGPMIGAWSNYMSDVQALQLQLMPSPLVNNWLQLQLDHQWISGDYTPRFSPFSNIWSFTANVDSGNQWPPFQGMKTSPKLVCDSLESSAADNHGSQVLGHVDTTTDFKQKIMRRKFRFHKWKLACRFPGLQIQA